MVTDRVAARAAKSALAARLSADPDVVGIGLARRDTGYVVKVNVADAGAAAPLRGDEYRRVDRSIRRIVRPACPANGVGRSGSIVGS